MGREAVLRKSLLAHLRHARNRDDGMEDNWTAPDASQVSIVKLSLIQLLTISGGQNKLL